LISAERRVEIIADFAVTVMLALPLLLLTIE